MFQGEKKKWQSSLVLFPQGTVCLLSIDDQFGDNMPSACLVKKTRFEIEHNPMPYHINMIRQEGGKQRPTDRFLLKVPNGMKNTDEEKGGVIASCMPLSIKEAVRMM